MTLLALAPGGTASANDLGMQAIVLPASGCMLSATEPVRLRIRNYGPTLPGGSIMGFAFRVDGGAWISENALFGNGPRANASFEYQIVNFTADLSAPGDHVIEGRVQYSADPNAANNISAGTVRHWAPTHAGTLTGPATPADAGTVQLSGQLGAVTGWQQSTDLLRWRALENTDTAQPYAALKRTTFFRATVRNGPCPVVESNTVQVDNENLFANGFES